MTIAMSRHIYSSEDNYIVDDCGWLGVDYFTNTVNCPLGAHCMAGGVKARSHQHQWQVLVGDESEECEQLGMDF